MGKRILIVDDAIVSRTMLKMILNDGGHEVVAEARNGTEAVAFYRDFRPDVVTMDITMPQMNGIEALRAIRKLDPNARVIMCSAMGQKHLILEAIEAGAATFLVKPFEKQNVLRAVNGIGQ